MGICGQRQMTLDSCHTLTQVRQVAVDAVEAGVYLGKAGVHLGEAAVYLGETGVYLGKAAAHFGPDVGHVASLLCLPLKVHSNQ